MIDPYLSKEYPTTLYQFTDKFGLNGILNQRSMRMSDIRSMNDPRELVWGQEIFLPAINEWIRHYPSLRSNQYFIEFINNIFAKDIRTQSFFSASFCRDGDNAHLWNEYGDNGNGVAIGFNPLVITSLGRPLHVQYPEHSGDDFTGRLMKTFNHQFTSFVLSENDLSWEKIGGKLFHDIRCLYLASKEEKWKPEQEERILWAQEKPRFREFPDDRLTHTGERLYYDVFERESRFGPVDYIVKKLDVYDDIPAFNEIVLGPNCMVTEEEIRSFTVARGYPEIPIRRGVKI